jgi:hypothetical protein
VLRRLEFHYVPKHASWLNMVESEIVVLRTNARIDASIVASGPIPKSLQRNASGTCVHNQKGRKIGRAYPAPASAPQLRTKGSSGLIRPEKLGVDPTLQATALHLNPVTFPPCNFEECALGGSPNNTAAARGCRSDMHAWTLQENDLRVVPRGRGFERRAISIGRPRQFQGKLRR